MTLICRTILSLVPEDFLPQEDRRFAIAMAFIRIPTPPINLPFQIFWLFFIIREKKRQYFMEYHQGATNALMEGFNGNSSSTPPSPLCASCASAFSALKTDSHTISLPISPYSLLITIILHTAINNQRGKERQQHHPVAPKENSLRNNSPASNEMVNQ